MKIYGVYDVKEKEQCVKIGTLAEIQKFFDFSTKQLNQILKKLKRFEILYLFSE